MSKYFHLSIAGVLLLILGACCMKAPVTDTQSPQVSVLVSDSSMNGGNPYSYMLYQSDGPRKERSFVTKDDSVQLRFVGRDVGGVKSVVVKAENGKLTSGPFIGVGTVESSVEGNSDIMTINGEKDCATNTLDHTVTVSSRDGSPVIVSVKVLDQGGISGRSNTTPAPDIQIVFSSP